MTGSQIMGSMEQVQVQVQAILARSLPVIEQQPISTPRLTCTPVPAPRKALVSLFSSLLLRRLSTSRPVAVQCVWFSSCLGLRDRCRSYARLTARLCAGLRREPEATAGSSCVGAEEWEAAGNRGRGACTTGTVKRIHSSLE